MTNFLQDLRFAARALIRSPGYAVVAVLTLALGIGCTTAMYAVLERVVLDPLPYPESDRLVRLKSAVPTVGPDVEWDVSEGAWWFFRGEARTIEDLGAYRRSGANVRGPEGPERARVAVITPAALRMLGAHPVVGRLIDEQDDDADAPQVVVLSYGFWQRQFGGDPGVVGQTLNVDERPAEIIGVTARGTDLPPELGVPSELVGTDLWSPLRLDPAGPFWNAHTQFRTIGRLRPDATIEAAQAEFDRLTSRFPEAVPSVYSREWIDGRGFSTRVYALQAYAVGEISAHLWILFGAVGLVLLIACANVANLFFVRLEARHREVAIRSALGAGKRGIAQHFFGESLVLALSAGAIGLILAYWGIDWLVALAPEGVPRLDGVRPDGSVVVFALGLVVVVAAMLALLPALRYAGGVSAAELTEAGHRATAGRQRQRVRSVLLVAQVALALVLLVTAGLLAESFRQLRGVDPGIRPDGVVTMQVALPTARYDDFGKVWQFYDAALERLRGLPGVTAAGVTSSLPFGGGFGCTVQGFEDRAVYERLQAAETTTCAGQEPTSPGYFEAMGIPVLRGRALTDADNDNPEVGAVVVSRAFAEKFWPGQDPIGKGVSPNGYTRQRFYRVVGVVGDVFNNSVTEPPAVAIYYPIVRIPETSGWSPPRFVNLVVRTQVSSPMSLYPAMQRAIAEVDAGIPLANPEELGVLVDRSMARVSFMMALLIFAATVSLLLAAIGLYGVLSYLVSRRTNEIGVRIALGAQPRHVQRLVVRGSLKLALLGLLIGVAAALALSRVVESLLYGVEPTHPMAYLSAAAILGSVAVVASWLPARRATRVDPMIALRNE